MRKLPTHEIERISPAAYKESRKTPLILILDNIRSANNVGSIFRTADAFALERLYLCGITATPPHRDIMKTAIGAEATVDWVHEEETSKVAVSLKNQGWTVLSVEQSDSPTWLQELQVPQNGKIALVLGNEVSGVDQAVMDVCDGVLEVPQFGTKHSLNVAVCTGVVCWEVVRQVRF